MADTELLSYGELADLVEHLPLLLREARRQHRLTMKQAGDQIGIASSTVLRLEAGQGAVLETAVAVLRWLGRPHVVADVTDTGSEPEPINDAPIEHVETINEGSKG